MGGDFWIVSLRAWGSLEIAANVVAMSVNSCALAPATGAIVPVKRFSDWKKRASWVRLSARLAITGARCPKKLGADWMAWLRSGPRSVSALPKPVRFSCDAMRVGRSKIRKTSSICTWTLVCATHQP